MAKKSINLLVNGKMYHLDIGKGHNEVEPSHSLAHTLRETLGLTGTKIGCDHGACGNCSVLMDGMVVPSCMVLTVELEGKNITTIEGLGDPKAGKLDGIQEAFVENTAFQCGFCTPGIIMSAKALINENPSPTRQEIAKGLSGNFCRCISHYHVLDAVETAVQKKRGDVNG